MELVQSHNDPMSKRHKTAVALSTDTSDKNKSECFVNHVSWFSSLIAYLILICGKSDAVSNLGRII